MRSDESLSTRPSPTESYALDRTALANERTFAAWLRTGLAALATGIGLEKFVFHVAPSWGIRAIAMILVALSALAFALAGWRFSHLGVKLARVDVKRIPTAATTLLSAFLVLCSLLAFVALWLLDSS